MKRAFIVLALALGFTAGVRADVSKGPQPILPNAPGPGPVVAPCGWQVCYQEYGACEQDIIYQCGGDRSCESMLGAWCEYWLEKCLAEDCPSDPPGNPGLIQ